MQGDFRPYANDSGRGTSVWTIAAGVFIGSLAATAFTWMVAEMRIRWELQQFTSAIVEKTNEAKQASTQMSREQEAMASEQRRQVAEQQRLEEARGRAAQEAKNRKEAAWVQFYKPTPGCASTTATVECANERIRARRLFESNYSAN